MLKRITKLIAIKPGEGFVTSLLFLYIVGVLTFYYILKPLRSALFLSNYDAIDLPKAYLLTALLAGPLVTAVFKLSRRVSLIVLLTWINLGIIVTLLAFGWAVVSQVPFLPYAYFTYVQIVSVLSVAGFWLLAGYIYDNRQAKRLYGLLGTGAIAGSIFGSAATDILKRANFGTSTLLEICAAICMVLILISRLAWRYRRPDAGPLRKSRETAGTRERTLDLLRIVFQSRHLKLIVGLIFLTMIASQIADWQVDSATQGFYQHLPKEEMNRQITLFRARFNLVTSLAGIALQLTVTHFIVQRVGIWAAILFLPVGLGLGSFGVLLSPSIYTVTAALGCNSIFRYSINRAGFELLFLPLSPDMRKRVKLFIDVFVDRAGRATAAFIILALVSGRLPLGLRGTATAIVLLVGGCIVLGLRLGKTYVDSFRQQLMRREVDVTEMNRFVTDPASLSLLITSLGSAQERQVLYALGLLQSARDHDFSEQLLPLLSHPSPYVREEAVRTLHALPVARDAEAERVLTDESEGVRLAAIEYLCLRDPGRTVDRLKSLLSHPNIDIRLDAARCATALPSSVFRPTMELVQELMRLNGTRSVRARVAALRLAARLPGETAIPLLRRFLHDGQPEVAGAAAIAAGEARYQELLGDIIPLLVRSDLRAAARQSLILFGPGIEGDLGEVLLGEHADMALRCEIPWVMSRFRTVGAADLLLRCLTSESLLLKYQTVKALNRLHEADPELPENISLVTVHIVAQSIAYYEGLALLEALRTAGSGLHYDLLQRALRERMDRQLEIIFRLLGLLYPQKDIYFAYLALQEERRGQRVAALEFLDNILKLNLKSIILPLLEESSSDRLLERASRLFGIHVPERIETFRTLLLQNDPWLRACSLHVVGVERMQEFGEACRDLSRDRDPTVRETAAWSLQRCQT